MAKEALEKFTLQIQEYLEPEIGPIANKYARNLSVQILQWTANEAKKDCIATTWSSKEFRTIFENKCINIGQHLDPNSRVNDGTIIKCILKGATPEEIVNKTIYELAPDISHEIREKVHMQSNVVNSVKTTKMYKCPNRSCGANKAKFNIQQTRSADEAATIQLVCLECGKQWIA